MNYMTCTTCKAIVQVNNTGICLGCQMGFIGGQNDVYVSELEKEESKIKKELQDRKKELEDAIEKGEKQEINIIQHCQIEEGRQKPKAKRGNRTKRSGTKQTKKEKG